MLLKTTGHATWNDRGDEERNLVIQKIKVTNRLYVFNENETAQFVYDKTHKVITISADYLTVGDASPSEA